MTAPIILERMPDASGDLVAQKRQHKYCLTGIWDEVAALGYCLTYIPLYLSLESLFRQNIQMRTQGGDLWYADVDYGPIPRMAGTWRISFDTTGGTVQRTHSLECVKAYTVDSPGPTGDADAKSLAIGLRNDSSITGTNIVVPVEKRTYSYRQPKGVVTEAYMDYLGALTGIVNSAPWHNRPAGEVLFLGAKGQTTVGGDAECDVSYDIVMSKNVTGKAFGSITDIDKKGHHVLDVIFEEKVGGNAKPNADPATVRIHRVYEELDFYTYLGF